MSKRALIILIAIIAVFAVVVGLSVWKNPQKEAAINNSPGSQNFYGNMDSEVTLIEYIDFQCEACYAYYPIVKEIKETYKDRVKFQIKYMPIATSHPYSMTATKYAQAAALQGKFFEMHDKIFEGQKTWENSRTPQEIFQSYANEVGLDMTKYNEDLKSDAVLNVIQRDLRDAKAAGATGTPTFILNGTLVKDIQPTAESISALLDAELKE